MRVSLPLVLVALCLAPAGCAWPGQPNPRDRPVPADRELRFGVLYGQNCAGCHGADGKLGPAPPLNDDLFRALVPEEELRHVISDGRFATPGQRTPMPAFAPDNGGRLTIPQIQVLVYEIKGIPYRTVGAATEPPDRIKVVPETAGIMETAEASEVIRPRWGAPGPVPKGAPPYLGPKGKDGRTSAEYEEIRKTVFAAACAGCHGDHGQGKDAGRIHDPTFLGLISDQALRRYVITGRPDFGMPDYAGKNDRPTDFKPLTPGQVDDLAALLASWR